MTTPSEEEERYFARKEAERREDKRRELERAAREVAEQRAMGDALHTSDDGLVARIRSLGFDGDTARVFDLMPLVHVAWADGSVSAAERRTLFRLLEARNIAPDSEAWLLVGALLETRPSDAFLDETLALLRDLAAKGGTEAGSIVDLSVNVAAASGGFLGLGGKISDEERELIAHIADVLGPAAVEEFQKTLG